MTLVFTEVEIANLPKKAQGILNKSGCAREFGVVLMESAESHLVYRSDETGLMTPCVVTFDNWRKVYWLDEQPPRFQDASDLEVYDEIVPLAKKGLVKDVVTCGVIWTISDTIAYMKALSSNGLGDEKLIHARRQKVQRHKLTCVRIWREAALEKVEKAELVKVEADNV